MRMTNHLCSQRADAACVQAAFQAALREEFMRIRATDPAVGANEAAALALTRLRERAPELLAARG